jgi:hypothetical protein
VEKSGIDASGDVWIEWDFGHDWDTKNRFDIVSSEDSSASGNQDDAISLGSLVHGSSKS